MNFLRLTAAALLTCGLAATYTFAADENKTEVKSVTADVHVRDQHITTQIRSSIAGDASLKGGGNNVGITTTGGTVLLRGTVTSAFAKGEIEKHAVAAAGSIDRVTSELRVVAPK